MKISLLYKSILVATSLGILTGFGLDDVHKKLSPGAEDCSTSPDPKKCKREQKLKGAGEVIAIGIAAKIIYDMVIDYRSSEISPEEQIVREYKKRHQTLPPEPEVLEYTSSIKPGDIVKAGKEVMIASNLVVVPGINSTVIDIQEQIEIYDNEKNDQLLKSLTKPVNEKTKKSGAFKNEFKFTLPTGMPQGVYPIKTLVTVNNVASKPSNNKMQLVLNVDKDSNYQIVAINQ